jgi:reactive intermediate/imine deaminase
MNDPGRSKSPAPGGPYRHAVRRGSVLAIAGQVGVDRVTRRPVGDVVAQTRQALVNLTTALEEAGASWADVIRVGAYLTDAAHFAAMNEVYREVVPEPFPARTTVYVGLNPGLFVEFDAIAVVE